MTRASISNDIESLKKFISNMNDTCEDPINDNKVCTTLKGKSDQIVKLCNDYVTKTQCNIHSEITRRSESNCIGVDNNTMMILHHKLSYKFKKEQELKKETHNFLNCFQYIESPMTEICEIKSTEICDNTKNNKNSKPTKMKFEKFDMDLDEYLKEGNSEEGNSEEGNSEEGNSEEGNSEEKYISRIRDILSECFNTLKCMNENIGFTHCDMKAKQILLNKFDSNALEFVISDFDKSTLVVNINGTNYKIVVKRRLKGKSFRNAASNFSSEGMKRMYLGRQEYLRGFCGRTSHELDCACLLASVFLVSNDEIYENLKKDNAIKYYDWIDFTKIEKNRENYKSEKDTLSGNSIAADCIKRGKYKGFMDKYRQNPSLGETVYKIKS